MHLATARRHVRALAQLTGYKESEAQSRKGAIAQYYRLHDIHEASKKKTVRIRADTLLAISTTNVSEEDSIRTAQFLQKEIPVRVSKGIKRFQNLPFIILTNPKLTSTMESYIRVFKEVRNFNNGRELTTRKEVLQFEKLLVRFLDDPNSDIINITQGFRDCHDHIVEFFNDGRGIEAAQEKASDLVQNFLDRSLANRLAVRILVQNHLLLSEQAGKDSNKRIGIIESKWKPAQVVEKIAEDVRKMWKLYCDNPPQIKLNGHTEAEFPFIPVGVDYILHELFNNSFRAIIESNMSPSSEMPAIEVTIAVNRENFIIRISDRGKGFLPEIEDKIWRYNFSTIGKFDNFNNPAFANPIGNELGGDGIGLPVSRTYTDLLGGSLEIKTMVGIGTDVYLTLSHIDPDKGKSFGI